MFAIIPMTVLASSLHFLLFHDRSTLRILQIGARARESLVQVMADGARSVGTTYNAMRDIMSKSLKLLPDTWSGFSQHSYDCQPLPTEKVSAAKVLKFRNDAFRSYCANKRYLDTVTQKFGWDTRKQIEAMSQHKLRRKIVEEMDSANVHVRQAQSIA